MRKQFRKMKIKCMPTSKGKLQGSKESGKKKKKKEKVRELKAKGIQ